MSPDNPTSLSLLERLRNQEQEAWRRLLHLYTPLVRHWLHKGGVNAAADTDDVCQDVFQAVAASLPNFHRDRPGDTFRGWLRGITRFKLVDYHRRRAQQPQAQGGTDAQLGFERLPEPTTEEADSETSDLYGRAVELVRGEFEDRTWQAFWRAAVECQAPADIAADLGMTQAAVRKAKSRVLRRLKEEVGDLIQ